MTRLRILCTAALLCVLVGCAQRDGEAPPRYKVVKSFEAPQVPLTVTVKVSEESVSVADSFRCVIEIRRSKDMVAELPGFDVLEKTFAPLLARDKRALPERLEDGFVVEGDEYELEPLVSGEYTIKPFTVTYKLGDEEGTLETEPIQLAVTSLGADDPRAELRDIVGPVSLPQRATPWWVWVLVAGGIVAVGNVVFLVLRRRRRSIPAEQRLGAHELAFEALRALREKDYIGRGLIEAFYVELSAILRWYIEHRFGLHAPEETTDEFLEEIARNGFFDLRQRTLLMDFLAHCDLVKFARYGPTADEIQQAFAAATTFIDETKEEPAANGL